ncbi:VOC family protein [Sphingopyxis sp. 113P3]|uniref:VOC family protein n=1 Tax=Sphingopyxis sp. (strain 113P3) TaxID=292913 RepID=UPI0006AD0F63|nr:VOC family protein [Sphingopyxis sp. 113P3]
MSMRGLVHHIDLTVADKERSRVFYDAVLGFLGYRRTADYGHGSDWDRAGAPFHSIGIIEARGEGAARTHDRYSPGLHHLAWAAESREDVDALHDLLRGIGATILDPPADYPHYGPTYYAVFFADPDGLKLEFVYGKTGK